MRLKGYKTPFPRLGQLTGRVPLNIFYPLFYVAKFGTCLVLSFRHMPSHITPMKLKVPVPLVPFVDGKMMRTRKWKQRKRTLILIGFYLLAFVVILLFSLQSIVRYVMS